MIFHSEYKDQPLLIIKMNADWNITIFQSMDTEQTTCCSMG